ncbi:MAG: plasmid stability protein stbC [Patescibacteria group bacterium]
MSSIQYTIRNIPEPVDKVLRRRARKQGQSFNATIVEVLQQATGQAEKNKTYNDLDWFYGSGGIGTEERKAFDAQHKIDKELWPTI